MEFYSQAHVAWPPVLPEAFVAKASCLTTRAQQILFLEETVSGPAEGLDGRPGGVGGDAAARRWRVHVAADYLLV